MILLLQGNIFSSNIVRIVMLMSRWNFCTRFNCIYRKIQLYRLKDHCLKSLQPPLLSLYLTCQVRYSPFKINSYRKIIYNRNVHFLQYTDDLKIVSRARTRKKIIQIVNKFRFYSRQQPQHDIRNVRAVREEGKQLFIALTKTILYVIESQLLKTYLNKRIAIYQL